MKYTCGGWSSKWGLEAQKAVQIIRLISERVLGNSRRPARNSWFHQYVGARCSSWE